MKYLETYKSSFVGAVICGHDELEIVDFF